MAIKFFCAEREGAERTSLLSDLHRWNEVVGASARRVAFGFATEKSGAVRGLSADISTPWQLSASSRMILSGICWTEMTDSPA